MPDCLFCDRSGVTREHVLSLAWLEPHMPTLDGYHFNIMRNEQGAVRNTRFKTQRPEVVRRAVCAECNSGWMNNLDLETQPMLTTMLTGRPLSLRELPNKARLAAWVSKIAMLIDSMQNEEPALAPDHARWLYTQRTPPPGWNIWLASLAAYPEHHATLGAFTLIRPEGRGFLATMSVNHFVAQAMVLPPAEPVGSHPMPDHVVQLWPPRPEALDWPPRTHLSDPDELERFGTIVAGGPVQTSNPPPQVPLGV
jgi:hypothetical protein